MIRATSGLSHDILGGEIGKADAFDTLQDKRLGIAQPEVTPARPNPPASRSR